MCLFTEEPHVHLCVRMSQGRQHRQVMYVAKFNSNSQHTMVSHTCIIDTGTAQYIAFVNVEPLCVFVFTE